MHRKTDFIRFAKELFEFNPQTLKRMTVALLISGSLGILTACGQLSKLEKVTLPVYISQFGGNIFEDPNISENEIPGLSIEVTYPTETQVGQDVQILLKVTNNTDTQWTGFFVIFKRDQASAYFTGFALAELLPEPSEGYTFDNGEANISFDSPIEPNSTRIFTIGLKPYQTGGYGADIAILLGEPDTFVIEEGFDFASVNTGLRILTIVE